MDCKSCIKNITKYLNDELEPDVLRDFIEHVEGCEECREELSIELLVTEGLISLEKGSVFDINRAYKHRIDNSERILKNHESLVWLFYSLAGMVAVAGIVLIILMMFS